MSAEIAGCKNLSVQSIIHDFIKKHKTLFVLYTITILLIPLQDIGMPHSIGLLTKQIQSRSSIFVPIAMIVGITAIIQVGYMLNDKLETHFYPALQQHIRETIVVQIMNMNNTNFEELRIGEILMRLLKLPYTIFNYIDIIKNIFIPQAIVYTFVLIYFMYYDKLIALMIVVLLVLMYFAIKRVISSCVDVSSQREAQHNIMHEEIDDILRNMISVLNCNQQQHELNKIDAHQKIYARLTRDTLACSIKIRYVFVPLVLGFFIFFNMRMYKQMQSKTLPPHVYVSLLLIVLYIMGSMWGLMTHSREMVLRAGIIKEAMGMFNQCVSKVRANNYEILRDPQYMRGFVFKDINYHYPRDTRNRKIFNNFNLHIAERERLLIVGKIGSGKSTLLKLMMKYQMPMSGQIYYNGKSYDTLSPYEIRNMVSYIPQQPSLFDRTIYENIAYGNKNVTRADIYRVVKEMGVESMFEKFTDGLDMQVGKYGSRLSGGQRQIIWILRAIFQNTPVIVMDEPTSAIDEATKNTVHHLLRRIMENRTVIMVTHDNFLEKLATRVITLQDGVIVNDKRVK